MPPARAQWSVDRRLVTASVDAEGKADVTVPLLDKGAKLGTLAFTITSDRHLRVEWKPEPGAPPLAGFEAWERGS